MMINLFFDYGFFYRKIEINLLKCNNLKHNVKMMKSIFTALSLYLLTLAPYSHAVDAMDIQGLMHKAVMSHPTVSATIAEHHATIENVKAAKHNLYPTPSFSSSYLNQDGATSRLGIRQPLWAGGKLTANINQSIYTEKATQASIFEQQNTVAKNTIDIWQNYLYAISLQQLYQNNLALLKDFDEMMTRRVKQGVSAQIDLDLVKNRALQDLNAYQAAQQQQRIAEVRLVQMIGEELTYTPNLFSVEKLLRHSKMQIPALEPLVFSEHYIQHPSVIKQQYQIEATKQQAKAQKAEQFPNVFVQYEQVYNHKTGGNDGQISLGLNYTPGAGFSNRALARAAEAKVVSLEQAKQATIRTVMENLQIQYQQLVSARDQEQSLISAVAGADLVIASYRRQFIAGRKSWLEVLNAVRDKASYEQQLLQVQSQMLGAFYKLQVDLAQMAWQQDLALTQTVEEYRPLQKFLIDASTTVEQPLQNQQDEQNGQVWNEHEWEQQHDDRR